MLIGCTISSFKHYLLDEIYKIDNKTYLSYLYEHIDEVDPSVYTSRGNGVAIPFIKLTKEVVDNCHANNQRLSVYFTSKDPEKDEDYDLVLSTGVD